MQYVHSGPIHSLQKQPPLPLRQQLDSVPITFFYCIYITNGIDSYKWHQLLKGHFARGNSGLLSTAILDFTTSQMTSFGLTARLLLLLITGYSLFTCQRQDATCTSRKGIVFKSASFDISFRNWTNLLISLRSHRQIFGSTCALKLNSTVNVLLLIMIANDCSTINPGPIHGKTHVASVVKQ